MTYLMWSIAPLIGASAAFSAGVTWATVPVFVCGLLPATIFVASYANPKSFWQLRSLDYACGFLSALALILWFVTKEPLVAVIFAIASDGFAAYPTLRKAWKYPESEYWPSYAASSLSALTSFMVAVHWDFMTLAFPTYLFFVMGAIALGAMRPHIGPKRKSIAI